MEFTFTYEYYATWESLPDCERELLQQALQSSRNAYAPYSKFAVGACLRLQDGTLVHGNNQENASYPQGLCAERVALFSASAQHPGKRIEAIALISPDSKDILSPCGACRQVLIEYEQRQQKPIRIIMGSMSGKVILVECAALLLPFCFSKENLDSSALV